MTAAIVVYVVIVVFVFVAGLSIGVEIGWRDRIRLEKRAARGGKS